VRRIHVREPPTGEPVAHDGSVRVEDIVVQLAEEPGELEGERILVAHPSMADPVHNHGRLAGRHQGRLKVREDPLDRTVSRRRDGLNAPTDENDPHGLPTVRRD
jgi:hypothetical protein